MKINSRIFTYYMCQLVFPVILSLLYFSFYSDFCFFFLTVVIFVDTPARHTRRDGTITRKTDECKVTQAQADREFCCIWNVFTRLSQCCVLETHVWHNINVSNGYMCSYMYVYVPTSLFPASFVAPCSKIVHRMWMTLRF